jgi:ribosomal protein S16
MALRIRLARYGAKKRPFYRIVVSNTGGLSQATEQQGG